MWGTPQSQGGDKNRPTPSTSGTGDLHQKTSLQNIWLWTPVGLNFTSFYNQWALPPGTLGISAQENNLGEREDGRKQSPPPPLKIQYNKQPPRNYIETAIWKVLGYKEGDLFTKFRTNPGGKGIFRKILQEQKSWWVPFLPTPAPSLDTWLPATTSTNTLHHLLLLCSILL